jgi:hypothetical protein
MGEEWVDWQRGVGVLWWGWGREGRGFDWWLMVGGTGGFESRDFRQGGKDLN